jgi:hypothetical protein
MVFRFVGLSDLSLVLYDVARMQGFVEQVRLLPPQETKQEREAKELQERNESNLAIPAPLEDDEDEELLPIDIEQEARFLSFSCLM